ncbi:MAG: hypothetical protein HKM04_08325 [Legionellales bacterium]|nr:hypothetical protein [Legionellales bacterium]
MNLSTNVKPISYLADEVYEKALSLFNILALGQNQIETGLFRSAGDVFADLDKD